MSEDLLDCDVFDSSSGFGWFYVIRTVPELRPERLKFGFTNDLARRYAQHKTSSPTAEVIYRCLIPKIYEQTLIHAITRNPLTIHVDGEVYDVIDVDFVLIHISILYGVLQLGNNQFVEEVISDLHEITIDIRSVTQKLEEDSHCWIDRVKGGDEKLLSKYKDLVNVSGFGIQSFQQKINKNLESDDSSSEVSLD